MAVAQVYYRVRWSEKSITGVGIHGLMHGYVPVSVDGFYTAFVKANDLVAFKSMITGAIEVEQYSGSTRQALA